MIIRFTLCFEWMLHPDVLFYSLFTMTKYMWRYWPFVRGILRSPVNSPDKGQWRGALVFSLICARINGWVNNRGAGDLRRHRAHYGWETLVCLSSAAAVICIPSKWSTHKLSMFIMSPVKPYEWKLSWLDGHLKPSLTLGIEWVE